jgi:hypothetical protein
VFLGEYADSTLPESHHHDARLAAFAHELRSMGLARKRAR